jgi:competence protein ComEC
VTPYGVLANLAAMPVVSALVMPAGMLGLIAVPFGFDGFFWWLMGIGIDWMIAVTRWVASLHGAVGRVTAFGTGPLIVASLGIVLLGLLRTPLRWSGGIALVAAIVWAIASPQPDVLVSPDARNVAVRGHDGRLHLMRGVKDNFLLKEWLAADADARLIDDATLGEGVSCDDAGCVAALADGRLVASSLRSDALLDHCERTALIVTTRQAPASCPAAVIDLLRLRRQGALALWWKDDGFRVEAARGAGFVTGHGRRRWPLKQSKARARFCRDGACRRMRRPRSRICSRTISALSEARARPRP